MEEKEKKVYRYIDTDIDRDLLLKNIRHNALSYAKHKGWSDEKSSEFFDSLKYFEDAIMNDRLSSDYTGDIKDSLAILTNGDSKWRNSEGQSITTAEYNKLSNRKKRKYKQDFFANREVASYLGLIAKDVYEKGEKAKSKNKEGVVDSDKKLSAFDFVKHGLWNRFMTHLSPSGSADTEAWLALDPEDSNKIRKTAGRAKYLRDYINSYINDLGEDIDFSNSPFKSREAYVGKLRELQTALLDGADDADFRMLNLIGASPDSYRVFFSTQRATPAQATPAQATPAQATNTPNVITQEAFDSYLDSQIGRYREIYNKQKYKEPFEAKVTPLEIDTKSKDRTAYESLIYNIRAQHGTNIRPEMYQSTSIGAIAQYIPQIFQTLDKGLKKTVDNPESKYNGWEYMPGSINTVDYSVLVFEPKTNRIGRVFIGDLDDSALGLFNESMLQKMKSELKKASSQSSGVTSSFKHGGNIQYMEGGDKVKNKEEKTYLSFANHIDALNEIHSKVDDFTEEYNANPRNRKAFKNENGELNLTGADITRLTSALVDLGNIFNPEPVTSAVMSLGSDFANFSADLSEGYSLTESLGGLAANLGMSAIGIIPFVGDALGNGTKIVRKIAKFAPTMKKWIPTVSLGVMGLGAAMNHETLLKTWNKFGKDGAENDLTVEDFRNIITTLQLALGTTKTVKSMKARNKAYEVAMGTRNKHIDLEVVNKNGGKEVVRFTDPDNVRALRDAKSINDVNKVLEANAATKGMTAATAESKVVEWFGADSRWYKPWKWRSKNMVTNVSGMYEIPDYAAMTKAKDAGLPMSVAKRYDILRKKVVMDAQRANVVDRGARQPTPTPAPATRGKGKLSSLSIDILKKGASKRAAYLYNKGEIDNSGKVLTEQIPNHSPAFEELVRRYRQKNHNVQEDVVRDLYLALGYFRNGGVLVPKALQGLKLPSFSKYASESISTKPKTIDELFGNISLEKPILNFPKGVYR